MLPTVTLRRYVTGHVFAEFGAVPRTIGNVTELGRLSGWSWSSTAAEGVVLIPGGAGAARAEGEMVAALRREGWTVDEAAPPRRQAVECVSCGTSGRAHCANCYGTGRHWPDGGVVRSESR
jgi:hypothetical protein